MRLLVAIACTVLLAASCERRPRKRTQTTIEPARTKPRTTTKKQDRRGGAGRTDRADTPHPTHEHPHGDHPHDRHDHHHHPHPHPHLDGEDGHHHPY